MPYVASFDESGDLDLASQRCVIAGALVSEGVRVDALDRDRWRYALAELAPWVPWPPHATDLWHVGMHVIWHLRHAEETGRLVPAVVTRARDRLAPASRAQLDAALASRRNRDERAVADAIASACRADRVLMQQLHKLVTQARSGVLRLIRQAANEARVAAKPIVFVGASEDRPNDTTVVLSTAQELGGDRYLGLLSVALERLALMVGTQALRSPEGQPIEVDVCSRSIAVIGDRQTPLLPIHVTRAIQKATGRPASTVPRSARPLRSRRVISGNASAAEPAAVIADWVANRLHWVVNQHDSLRTPLGAILARVRNELDVDTPRVALAAAGRAWEIVGRVGTDAASELVARLAAEVRCQWAREQAMEVIR